MITTYIPTILGGTPAAAGTARAEASSDLYASPWRTFRQITFPQLVPAIVAGFLLAFTFSFDDYVITSLVSGPGSSTLPVGGPPDVRTPGPVARTPASVLAGTT